MFVCNNNKKEIKNGMYFKYNGCYYIKVGNKCVEIKINDPIDFDDIPENEITAIFKSNGNLLVKRRENE